MGLIIVWLILLVLFVVALAVVAQTRPVVLDSRLVRIGAVVLVVSLVLISFLPSLITGLLFMFLAPIALLVMVVGTIMTFVTSEKRLNEDVAALAVAAKSTSHVWPDDSPLREIDQVVKHGPRAGAALVSLLRFESDDQLSDGTWSPHMEQQAELALCRIYGELPSGARTVYDTRSSSAENRHVKLFWETRVRSAAGPSPRR